MCQPICNSDLSTFDALTVRHIIVKERRNRCECITLLYIVSECAECDGINLSHGLALSVSIRHDTGEFGNLGYPASVNFAVKRDD